MTRTLFCFGYGLSYTWFEYYGLSLNHSQLEAGQTLEIELELRNAGAFDGDEVVQLYVRYLVASVTRPVRELKAFQRIHLTAGASTKVRFNLSCEDLSFYDNSGRLCLEPGKFHLWVGGDSRADLWAEFEMVN